MASIPDFPKFHVHGEETSAGVRWRKYIARFENLIGGMGIADKHARKRCLLLHYAGEEVFEIVDTFTDAQKGGETEEGYKTLKKSLTDCKYNIRSGHTMHYIIDKTQNARNFKKISFLKLLAVGGGFKQNLANGHDI